MERRIILVRAVNVGGTARLPMERWREIAGSLGAEEVSTYIASGNMIARIPGDPREFDRALERAVEREFGFHREVVSRSAGELSTALESYPHEVLDPSRSFIIFLTGEPRSEALAAARGLATGEDVWELIGAEVHLRHAHGASKPGIAVPALLRALGVEGTARNLRTAAKLLERARG